MREGICPVCKGCDPKCKLCRGRGSVTSNQKHLYFKQTGRVITCPVCHGHGAITIPHEEDYIPCIMCKGTGYVTIKQSQRIQRDFDRMSKQAVQDPFDMEGECECIR
jgi:DnaJ-class molecular chaperone